MLRHQVEKAPLESYADVGGLEQQVTEIKEAVELPLTHPELYEDIGIKPPKVWPDTGGACTFESRMGRRVCVALAIVLQVKPTDWTLQSSLTHPAAVELPLTHPELYEDIGIKPPNVGVWCAGRANKELPKVLHSLSSIFSP
jgi:hypothetical protein